MNKFNCPDVVPMVMAVLLSAGSFMPFSATAQNSDSKQAPGSGVQPMGTWLEFKQVTFSNKPILMHMRTGVERAILMPEPVQRTDPLEALPGCEVVVDVEVVGFYPRGAFDWHTIRFTGLNSGDIYELRVRASPAPDGQVQPIQINR